MADHTSESRSRLPRVVRPLASGTTGQSVALNVLVMLFCQALSSLLAIALDGIGLSDATVVIVFVLGVLVTAILTDGQRYSLAASVVSILCYNFFLIEPRFSLVIDGRAYVGTIVAMLVFALLASYLVTSLRTSARLTTASTLIAERERLRANLLRSVSHDLRTPLTSISGNADMLLDPDVALDDMTREKHLQAIRDDASWLLAVVENLLAITRIEDGDVELSRSVEVVDEIIEEALRHVGDTARRRRIDVVPSPTLLLVRVDTRLIVQVVVNLVNNAAEHTPEGTTVTISSWRERDTVYISVADDGPGIPDDRMDQAFEPFHTSGDTRARGRHGMGLGLALCRSIVQAHGGTIRVEPTRPHGARFVFSLPAEEMPHDA